MSAGDAPELAELGAAGRFGWVVDWGGEPYCFMCRRHATEGHLASARHLQRVRDYGRMYPQGYLPEYLRSLAERKRLASPVLEAQQPAGAQEPGAAGTNLHGEAPLQSQFGEPICIGISVPDIQRPSSPPNVLD